MSPQVFRVDEHVLPCQHIRHDPQATAGRQEDTLQLAVKQYTPLNNLEHKTGDITIVGGHGNGFSKVGFGRDFIQHPIHGGD